MPLLRRGIALAIICGMEKIATDTYSFERVREGGFVYVDKTAILKLLADGSLGTQFFVARPRRFGKSLAVSTLQCLFEGRRQLFKGLAIEPEWDWSKTYPVLKLDMGSCQAASVSDLWRKIDTMMESESRRRVRRGNAQPLRPPDRDRGRRLIPARTTEEFTLRIARQCPSDGLA